ncbi:MAG: hypothetical protein Hens3KO_14760 [Henriciella sp.]
MRAVIIAALACLMTSPAIGQEVPLDLAPGSNIYWLNGYEGGYDQSREQLIALGDDFAIYKTISEYLTGDVSDYFALFSGIDYRTCDGDMPTADERRALSDLWPLTEGGSAQISLPELATIEVGAATEFYLMDKRLPAHNVTIDYSDNENTQDEALIVLDQIPVTVAIRWSETEKDTATLITGPKPEFTADLSEETIGSCAGLLKETTN